MDAVLSISNSRVAGSVGFDVIWDPGVLALQRDSVQATSATVTRNADGAASGYLRANAVSAGGMSTSTRLLRVRFRVISPVAMYTRVDVQTLELRGVLGEVLSTASTRGSVLVRIP